MKLLIGLIVLAIAYWAAVHGAGTQEAIDAEWEDYTDYRGV